jgi:hypothetical protein
VAVWCPHSPSRRGVLPKRAVVGVGGVVMKEGGVDRITYGKLGVGVVTGMDYFLSDWVLAELNAECSRWAL